MGTCTSADLTVFFLGLAVLLASAHALASWPVAWASRP